MNKILRFLVMLPKGLWRALGADVDQLNAILTVKLKMDDRKPLSFGRQQRSQKPSKYTSTISFIFTLAIGLVYMLPFIMFDNVVLASTMFLTMMMVFLTFGLIIDFSNVLVDTRDKLIIFPKPVNDRTIFLSRLLHIGIYFFRIVLPMSLASWIAVGFVHGWKAVLWFPVPLLLMSFFCLFFVMGCYLLLLRLSSPQRFKETISYFQVAFSILIFGSYFLPRAIQSSAVMGMTINTVPWFKYFPSYWIATCWSWVDGKAELMPHTQWLSFLALVLPFLLLWFTVRFLAPQFIARLSGIDSIDVPKAKTQKAKTAGGSKFYIRLANLLNRSDEARAGFMITWLQSNRSRTFRMRVYPMFAFVPIYFVYLLTMNKETSFAETWEHLPQTKTYLLLLYMTGTVIMNAINYITMSEQYKAAWPYYSSPVSVPGNILAGSFKAIWLKYFFPFIAVIGIFVMYVWGLHTIIDVLLAMANVTLYVVCVMRVGHRSLPFSMPEQIKNSGGKVIVRMFFVFILMGVLGFGHWIASMFWWLEILFLVLTLIFTWLVWDGYNNTDWKGIKAAEDAY